MCADIVTVTIAVVAVVDVVVAAVAFPFASVVAVAVAGIVVPVAVAGIVGIVGSSMLNRRMLMTSQHFDRHLPIHRWSWSYRSALLTDCPDRTVLDGPAVAGDQCKCRQGHHPSHVFQVNQFHVRHDPKYIRVPWPFSAAGISVNDSILRIFMQPAQ